MSHRFALSAIACAVSLSFISHTALAQESKQEHKDVEIIVVSGTPAGIGINKKDASFAVTNVDASNIERIAPKSTADLFKAVPGVWVESSGGESGANVFVRGFPGSGDAPFLTVSLEGSPVYPAPTLSFLENSTLFRLDETIESMEALRGGPNPVVSNGQPGLTTNFRLKRGSEDAEALAKYTTSDYGLQRVDLVLSGEVSDDLYFMLGGYLKRSPGIRDAGFNSEQGQQVTINLTKELDKGEINLYSRHTDDHGTWYLPTPVNIEGIDASYTQIGSLNRQASIHYGPDNESLGVDFGEGRGWDGHVSGGSIKLELANDWHITDRFSLTQGAANTYGLVPNGAATTVAEVADNGTSATGAVTGNLYLADTPIQQIGRWVVLKDIDAFTNDLAISKQWDNLTTAFGLYTANTQANDWWSLGNQSYHVLQSGGENLTGIDCNAAPEGCGWNYDINGIGDGSTDAIYFAASYDVTKSLTLDAGIRNENHQIEYTVDEGLTGNISKSVSYDETELAWTVGLNWMFTENQGVFARISEGSKMPFFDDFRDNYGAYQNGEDLIKDVSQLEVGYKHAADNFDLYATAFFNEVKGDTFVRQPGSPAEILTNEAYGIEIDFNYYHESGFSINLNSTIQETEITESPVNQGNEAQRQPGWHVRITPSYDIEFDNGMYASIYGNISAVGDRYANNENTVTLPGYEKIDLGMILNLTDEVQVQLSVSNLTDENALTEGDPRDSLSSNGRYILPRTVDLSVSYQF